MAVEIADDHLSDQISIEMGMANETGDHCGEEKDKELADRIRRKLPKPTSISSEGNIFRVPERLRSANNEAYDPCMLAIGPYHRCKESVSEMEEHKKEYLKNIIERGLEDDLTMYVSAMRKLEPKARESYVESTKDIDQDQFIEMMVLDGCFIVELLRRFWDQKMMLRDRTAFIFSGSFTKKLGRDLLLVENQLPFDVLEKLFSLISQSEQRKKEGKKRPEEQQEKHQGEQHKELQFMILYFLAFFVFSDRWPLLALWDENSTGESKHLLGFVYDKSTRKCPRSNDSPNNNQVRFMRCATELKDAGIKFEVRKRSVFGRRYKKDWTFSLFDIKFKNGIMKIPRLEITGETESIFRNLIAYEQFSPSENRGNVSLVSDYMKFMDCLINSQEDVKLLCMRNILHNCLGDDEMVAKMFNKFAKLRHKYLDSPWPLISISAAILLLILTSLQTVFSVVSYYK